LQEHAGYAGRMLGMRGRSHDRLFPDDARQQAGPAHRAWLFHVMRNVGSRFFIPIRVAVIIRSTGTNNSQAMIGDVNGLGLYNAVSMAMPGRVRLESADES
jgi:hypothetical protein